VAIFTKKSSVELSSAAVNVSFKGSGMGRGLTTVKAKVLGHNLTIATSHLESPMPPHQWFSDERKAQQALGIKTLDALAGAESDVVWGGDFNWSDERDGHMELTPGWKDAWIDLVWETSVGARGEEDPKGFTYDAKVNKMLFGGLRLRLDRILAKMGRCFELSAIEMVGREPIEGLLFVDRGQKKPVFPSDHFGLLLTIELRDGIEAKSKVTSGGAKEGESGSGEGRVVVPFSGIARRLRG
jgi:hypothetical protein